MPTKFFNLDRDPQFTANSDYFIASQKAVKTALDTKADASAVYTKTEVDEIVQNIDALPTQIDNAGKFLTTDGENASWSAIDTIFWANYGTTTFAEIYDKAVSGKFVACKYSGYITTLSDMGSTSDLTPSAHIFSTIFENYKIDIKVTPEDKWSFVAKPILPGQSGNEGKALVTDGENASWEYTSVINDVTNASETGLSKLVINKLSQEEYDNLLEQDAIQDNELYIINDGNSQYVTEEELQQSLVTKADVDNVYTKEEVYTKNEVDNIVSTKADQETTYTKNEVDDLLANFEGGDSLPSQEGNEGKSLVTDGTNASWEYTTIRRNLEDGTETGLSQLIINTLSKERYNELEANGQINENELYITSGDDVEQPSKLSDFENDVGFITINDIEHKADKETTYTKDEVDELLANFEGGESLPEQIDNAGKALVTNGENAYWEYTSKINDITNSTEIGLSQLVINKLTQDEYNTLLNNEEIRDDELYIINDGNSQYVTDDELENALSVKADQETTYTKNEVDSLLANVGGGDNLPEQTDNAGKALVTDGTNASWEYTSKINDITNANETGLSQLVINKVTMAEYRELQNAGLINENELYMTEELGGSNLPSQDGNEGKFLTTNGINPSWNYASVLNQNGVSTGLSQLVINEVTQEEYNALIEADAVKDDEIYMIQDVDTDYVTQSELETRLENIGGGNAGRNIGDIFYTTRLDTELNGAVECNGGTYNIGDFEGEQSIGNLLSNGSLPYISLADYENAWKTNGSVRCFGYDEGGDTFRVPTLQDVYIKAGIAETFDEFNAESLPNITGYLGTMLKITSTAGGGVFTGSNDFTSTSKAGTSSGVHQGTISFDASNSSEVYKNGASVNPDNIRYRAMVQLYNGANEIAIVDYTNQVEEAVAQGIQEIETAVSNGINTNIPVIDLGTVTGEQLLEVNKAYKMILSGKAISFNMDSVEIVADVVNQIKIYLQVKRNTTIDWGTTYFYNGTIPEITGGQYEIYYEYNHNLGTWVVGAMSVGVA